MRQDQSQNQASQLVECFAPIPLDFPEKWRPAIQASGDSRPWSVEKSNILIARDVAVCSSQPIWMEEEMSGFNTEFILHLPKSFL